MYKQTCQISPSYIMYGKNRLAETVHVSPRLSTDLKNERSRLQTEQNRAKEEQNNRDPHRCTRHPGRQAQPTHLIYERSIQGAKESCSYGSKLAAVCDFLIRSHCRYLIKHRLTTTTYCTATKPWTYWGQDRTYTSTDHENELVIASRCCQISVSCMVISACLLIKLWHFGTTQFLRTVTASNANQPIGGVVVS